MNRQWLFILALTALLCGCASRPQPFVYHDDRDEKPGPGMFSGDQGGIVVSSDPSEPEKKKE